MLFETERRHRLGFRLFEGRFFNRLAFAIETIKFSGDLCRFRTVIRDKQARAERCITDTAPGINTWAEQKTEVKRRWRAVEPRNIHQRAKTDGIAVAQRDQ